MDEGETGNSGVGNAPNVQIMEDQISKLTTGAAAASSHCTGSSDAGNDDHPFVKALKYDVVTNHLSQYLNFEDLKAFSLVSQDCLTAIRKTQTFSDKAKLIIGKELVSQEILKESTYLWKHLSLDLSLPVEIVDLIADILESVETISIGYRSDGTTMSDADAVHYLGEIFKKTKDLRELELDMNIMNKVLHDVFSAVEVQQMICQLQGLSMVNACVMHGSLKKLNSLHYLDLDQDDDEDDDNSTLKRNFFQLSQLPLRLKKFVVGKFDFLGASDPFKFIPKIVEASKDTLEELELHLRMWNSEEMKVIRCSKLKRLALSLTSEKSHCKIAEAFIKNQPPLEELVIETKEFPITLLQSFQGRLARMRKFHIKTQRFVDTSEPVDWTFLGMMTKLKDFYIRKPYSRDGQVMNIFGCGDDIIGKLPATTTSISILGVTPFWRDDELEDHQPNIGTLLSRFENLTALNLIRCDSAVNDAGLQSLIQNCPKLTKLAFSHCPDVTDSGLSGNSGTSLADLKGLTHLQIKSCPNITPECLLNIVKFGSLRSFDYFKNVRLEKEFLLQIVRQNPCLEEVTLHLTSYDNDSDYLSGLKEEVKKLNPRVHQINIMEQLNWEDQDSDSDAENDLYNIDGDSDFSGGYGGPNWDWDEADHDFDDYDDDYDDSPDYFDVDDLGLDPDDY